MVAHEHAEPCFGVVMGGWFLERIGGDERHYTRGCVTFCPAGTVHSQDFGPLGARQILFRPDDSWLGWLEGDGANPGAATYTCSESSACLADRLLSELGQDDEFSAMACEGILLELVAAFGRTGAAGRSREQTPRWLLRARDFIHDNAHLQLDMKRIAEVAKRHEVHLAREFRRFFGLPIGSYARRLRAQEAARLLSSSRASLTEVALSCGFASHSHFCRVFKAHYGLTPSQYRSRLVS